MYFKYTANDKRHVIKLKFFSNLSSSNDITHCYKWRW